MQPLSGNQRPDLRTALMNMSLVLRLPQKMHLCRSSSNVPRLPSFLEMLQNPHVLLTFDTVHDPLCLPRKTTLQRPKVARTCGALYVLTSRRASRHNGVRFFNISTSKNAPNIQTRQFFTLLTSKCASCTFSTSQLPTGLRDRDFFTLLTAKSASRNNGVPFFILHLAKWLRTCHFSKPTFRPSGATNHWKNTFLPFHAPASSFF